MNIIEGRNNLRRLSVPRRSVERDGEDRRRGADRRQNSLETQNYLEEDAAPKKFVRINVTPGERTLLQDMYLIED